MDLYKLDNGIAKYVKPKELSGPKGEEELQNLIEKNLSEIFELTFIDSELPLQRKELDTLAFDKENKRIVVIEYKVDKDSGIFDQGITYLTLVHENREFIRLKTEKKLECGILKSIGIPHGLFLLLKNLTTIKSPHHRAKDHHLNYGRTTSTKDKLHLTKSKKRNHVLLSIR